MLVSIAGALPFTLWLSMVGGGAGVDDVARSLFYAVTVIVIFLIGWGAGIVFFLGIKQKTI